MSSSNCESCYLSCGCNKTPHAADWGRNGLICFASCNAVVIYDPIYDGNTGKILHILPGHTGKVCSARWVRNFKGATEHEIISASADGKAILWRWNAKQHMYIQEESLKGHSNTVNIADGYVKTPPGTIYEQDECGLWLATASVDSTVRIWTRNSPQEKIECVDVLEWGSGFCLDVRFAHLPGTGLTLLACAADDNKIHLFAETPPTEARPGGQFLKVHVLKGHEDWVRAMDFTLDAHNCLYLATGSQDTYIRVFKIQHRGEGLVEAKERRERGVQGLSKDEDIQPEEKVITVPLGVQNTHFSVILETILTGHEGWVYGVSWQAPQPEDPAAGEILGGANTQPLRLLSSSMDKTVVMWSPNASGVWLEEARLGEVGGNTLGFYGGKFGEGGKAVMAHGYQGSFHVWRLDVATRRWEPCVVVGGHVDSVTDLTWDPHGNYLISVGNDQTARLHAPWIREGATKVTWHELARPQIHGYDLSCVVMLGPFRYASGAEEKVVRAFSAPTNFIDNLRRISKVEASYQGVGEDQERGPRGAAVPALGLSNKPVFEDLEKNGTRTEDKFQELYFSPLDLKNPPTEEDLLQNTLWPEVQKLYGHGFELFTIAARNDGRVLASACKASTQEHAAIILWNTQSWLLTQKLVCHTLTVTQMSFSPDSSSLLAVSRDRRFSNFNVGPDGMTYTLTAVSESKGSLHTRVIWSCAWTMDSRAFATGSRDGKIGVWSRPTSKKMKLLTSLDLGGNTSVTALAFAPVLRRDFNILAVGLETGAIHLYKYREKTLENLWVNLQDHHGHHLAVKRLAFRPVLGQAGVPREDTEEDILQLASCGQDHLVRVYDVLLTFL